MLDYYSWQEAAPYAYAEELKGFNPDQPRRSDGRWGSGAGRSLVGQVYLDAQKVGGSHTITVHSSRVRKYAGHSTVESFIAGHKRGRAAAMRELTADHAAGRISFGQPETGESPAAAKPKHPADTKPAAGDSAAKDEATRSLRDTALAKPGASLKPIARDANRSDLDTLRVAHAQVAHSGDAARLSHVRRVLGDYSRPEQDRMLAGAIRAPNDAGVSLSQISDNKAIDSAEKAAAYAPAGEPFHILRTTHRGRKASGAPALDEVDGSDLSGVTEAAIRDLFDDALLASAGFA